MPAYVSRGGVKLRAALDAFGIDPSGVVCADLGCSTGGFTDCLVQAGASRVFAVDTAYGELAWSLRKDPRVVVMERTNALHAEPAAEVGLVVIDLGWTPQRLAVPAAARWLGAGGRIVSLVKPHYEVGARGRGTGVLPAEDAERVALASVAALAEAGFACLGMIESPVLGGARKRGAAGKGNREWLALLTPSGRGAVSRSC